MNGLIYIFLNLKNITAKSYFKTLINWKYSFKISIEIKNMCLSGILVYFNNKL